MARSDVIRSIADKISALKLSHPLRVFIDGIDASGKTRLADELAATLRPTRRDILRISLDDFHLPRETRHQQGRYSPMGYYENTFDYPTLIDEVLKPLGPGGNLRYRTSFHDLQTETKSKGLWSKTSPDCILILDEVFLKRPELAGWFDFHIFTDCGFETAFQRAMARDMDRFGPPAETRRLYLERYFPGQRLYLEQVKPHETADMVFYNEDFENPRLTIKK